MADARGSVPTYAIPQIGESVRVYDGTRWGKTVPAVYMGYRQVADDFFMHDVKTDNGTESIASYNVYRLDGKTWRTLSPKPRMR